MFASFARQDSRTALSHAQALRDREAAENTRLLSESADGKAAVEDAISVLTSFYDAAAAVEGNETVAAPADAPSAGFDADSKRSLIGLARPLLCSIRQQFLHVSPLYKT